MSLGTDGVLQLNNLMGSGNRLLQTDANGKIIPFPMGTSGDVLYGDGTWGGLPLMPPELWLSSGSNIYFNGKVGIGTSSPTFPLDVIGDVRISNNLYVGGGIVISDKVNANAEVVTGKMVADSIVTDSTRGFYGTTKFNGDVRLSSKINVDGSATVGGDFKTMGSLTFAGDKTIKYTPGSPGRSPSISFGIDVPIPPDPCISPSVGVVNQFSGIIQSYGFTGGPSPSVMTMGYEGPNGIIDLAGSAGSGTSPRLLINYSCGKDVQICTGANGGNIDLSSGPNGGNVSICTGASGNVLLANGSGTRVGVATSNPTAKFEIQNDNPAIITACISKTESATQTRRMIFEPKLDDGDYNYLTQANDAGIFWSDGASGAGRNQNAGFVIAPWPNVIDPFGIRITHKGDVGIGISNPEAKMHIMNESMTAGIGLKVSSRAFDQETGVLSEMELAEGKAFVGATKTPDGTFIENFVVYADGHVRARDIKVTLNPLTHGDFVFEKNYVLMPLNELENYYNLNHHLPNVPSTSEVEKNNGINLGEMSEIQLVKIEEMTLYIVDLNKKLNQLAEKIEMQQKEIKELQRK